MTDTNTRRTVLTGRFACAVDYAHTGRTGRGGTLRDDHALSDIPTHRGVAAAPVLDAAVARMHALGAGAPRVALAASA